MNGDSYHTRGAIKDRAAAAKREVERNEQLARIATALERLADAFEEQTKVGGAFNRPTFYEDRTS
jgi:hypothetical protein